MKTIFDQGRKRYRRIIIGTLAGAAVMAMNCAAWAQTQLKVIVFPTLSNLAQFAAQSRGYYSKHGLAVELICTPNSDELRDGLAQGRYHIAHGGVDNAVASRNRQGRSVRIHGRQQWA